MASSCSLFLFLVLTSAFAVATHADLIANICGKTSNPDFCSSVIRSDPRSKGANLATIGRIAVDKAIIACKQTIFVAKSVRNKKNKMMVSDCLEVSWSAIESVKEYKISLPPRTKIDVSNLQTKASALMTDMDTCDQGFEDADVVEPQKLKEATSQATAVGQILLIVANSF